MSYNGVFGTGVDLEGTDGDDVLMNNGSAKNYEGKGGADLFVISDNDQTTTITDFEQGEDKIVINRNLKAFTPLSVIEFDDAAAASVMSYLKC